MSRKVLGRGLNALLGEGNSNYNENYLEIDIELIEPNANQPRSRFAEENLEELAQSIRANGIVQPILVRRRGAKYQIVAGERRWRASQKANLKKIPAVIKEVADEKLLELALIENIQREELNVIEEAKAYKKLIETIGLTQEMIAERVGKKRTTITTYLRFLKLPNEIQMLVEDNKISAGHARALLMTNDVEYQKEISKKIIEMSLSVRETEKAVKRLEKGNLQINERSVTIDKEDANVKSAEAKLQRHLNTKVGIKPDGKGTGGRIEIEYYSESDLDRIYQLIIKGKIK